MGRLLPTDSIGSPARWHLVFQPVAELWWVNWLVPGRFKHVRAFGVIPDTDVWIFFDVGFRKAELFVATGRAASVTIGNWIEGATVISIAHAAVAAASVGMPFFCTTAVRHLIGLRSCALRPDALLRHCLAQGARILHGQAGRTAGPTGSHAEPAHADGPATAGSSSPDSGRR
jgi:hypothetical protein